MARGDEVTVVYGPASSADPMGWALASIRRAHSSDTGRTIDRRDDLAAPGRARVFFHPQLVRTATGAVELVYYAGAALGDEMASVRRTRFAPDGQMELQDVVVEPAVTFVVAKDTTEWLGDYFGLAARDARLYGAYVDNSDGHSHLTFVRLAGAP